MKSSVLTRVKTQIEGLKARPDLEKGAAFKAKDLEAILAEIEALERKQEVLKTDLHAVTQKIAVQETTLNDAFQRNLGYVQMVLGKRDKAIEALGGKVATRSPRRKPEPEKPKEK